ncbi:hypothetical protein [Rhodococcus sp. UFZ-B548]
MDLVRLAGSVCRSICG